MTEAELNRWFNEIAGWAPRASGALSGMGDHAVEVAATRFVPEAESAIGAAFPASHALVRQWNELKRLTLLPGYEGNDARGMAYQRLLGVFDSAHAQLKAGRRGSFTSIVRAAAENNLLGVAEELLDNKFPTAAAAVTAGGALEVHLRGLCERQGVTWAGKGQIENYKAALEREHKADATRGIGTTDGKLVTGWGGLRNDAAHDPGEFSKTRSADDVRAMITQIREFISRTT